MWKLEITNLSMMTAHTTRHFFATKEDAQPYYDEAKQVLAGNRRNTPQMEIESLCAIAAVKVNNVDSVVLMNMKELDRLSQERTDASAEILQNILDNFGEKVAELYAGMSK